MWSEVFDKLSGNMIFVAMMIFLLLVIGVVLFIYLIHDTLKGTEYYAKKHKELDEIKRLNRIKKRTQKRIRREEYENKKVNRR